MYVCRRKLRPCSAPREFGDLLDLQGPTVLIEQFRQFQVTRAMSQADPDENDGGNHGDGHAHGHSQHPKPTGPEIRRVVVATCGLGRLDRDPRRAGQFGVDLGFRTAGPQQAEQNQHDDNGTDDRRPMPMGR